MDDLLIVKPVNKSPNAGLMYVSVTSAVFGRRVRDRKLAMRKLVRSIVAIAEQEAALTEPVKLKFAGLQRSNSAQSGLWISFIYRKVSS